MNPKLQEWHLISYGEAMIRLSPIEPWNGKSFAPSAAATYLRTVGGDEMNVCVALSKLGLHAQWVSVLPTGPLGDVVYQSALQANVDLEFVILKENEEVGTFYVIPDEKRVFYQRKNSAWAKQERDLFDWKNIFSQFKQSWYHVTGISPLTATGPAYNWCQSIENALALNIPITMDLNHRKLLGSLLSLWSISTPYIKYFKLLILSLDQIQGLASILHYETPKEHATEEDPIWITILQKIYDFFKGPRIACCFKTRTEEGVQKRWSIVCDKDGIHSTFDHPVYHKPKDECGGGSSWAAGFIDAFFEYGLDVSSPVAQRRADLMAALSQEIIGDHSATTRSELIAIEHQFNGKSAYIGETYNTGAAQRVENTLQWIMKSKVIAILRAKNSVLTVKRAFELVDLGCKVLEVTLDSENVMDVLRELINTIPPEKCLIGAGTVTNYTQLDELARIGIRFAISPILPKNFVQACHSRGILAIPAAFTPNELWQTKLEGAKAVKLFPAQMYTPQTLKDVLGVGAFGEMNIIPSGGITPEKAQDWLNHGAVAVGVGRRVVGGDISFYEDDKHFEEARKEWLEVGLKAATELFSIHN